MGNIRVMYARAEIMMKVVTPLANRKFDNHREGTGNLQEDRSVRSGSAINIYNIPGLGD